MNIGVGVSEREAHLKPTVQHGVGAFISAQRLQLLQVHRVFGIEPEEVNELGCSINLGLYDSLTLNQRRMTLHFYKAMKVPL